MAASGAISGISKTSLWTAWKAVRSEIRRSSVRDVVDWLEYDIDPDKWIGTLLRELATGTYAPSRPLRYTEAKSNGFSRRMTMPAIPDLVLYRAIVDHVYRKAKRFESPRAFCERDELPGAEAVPDKPPRDPFMRAVHEYVMDYESASRKTFRAWLRYNQYRKLLALRRVHKFIVVTDITNFFDSVLYSRIADSLSQIAVPPRMLGLLFFLLEHLSIRDAFTESPRIGLPVEEFSCSRKLAHMVLYPHDARMVKAVGEESYIRWMDDQNLGVASKADGLRCLSQVSDSLARLHLTANAKKSKVLSIAEAKAEFHFSLNEQLDQADVLVKDGPSARARLAREVNAIHRRALKVEGQGHWDKVIKRLYRLAALAGVRALRRRALKDMLSAPSLARRVCDYMRATGTADEYLSFAQKVWDHPEQVYDDVNAVVFEGLLRVEPNKVEASRIAKLASEVLRGVSARLSTPRCQQIAPLVLLRFGNRRSLPLLARTFQDGVSPATRASAIVYAGFGRSQTGEVERATATHLRAQLPMVVLMLRAVAQYATVPERWALRCKPGFDPLTARCFVDMRGLAAIRLLLTNENPAVGAWLNAKRGELLKTDLSEFDKRLIGRLWPVLSSPPRAPAAPGLSRRRARLSRSKAYKPPGTRPGKLRRA